MKTKKYVSPLTSEHESITEPAPGFKKFRIVLIKPSKYDDEGYVIRFWKGVLPSNTLNVLHGSERQRHMGRLQKAVA